MYVCIWILLVPVPVWMNFKLNFILDHKTLPHLHANKFLQYITESLHPENGSHASKIVVMCLKCSETIEYF
jgi:hypothetical protein